MADRPEIMQDGPTLRRWVRQQQQTGRLVGFVPTMGGLHAGHLSLARQAAELCDRVVVSIFVNPTQFGPQEDLDRYPRQLAQDVGLLSELPVDIVFAPSTLTMYPKGHSTFVEPPAVAGRWEGICRPGHFRGVATVVLKLFQLVPADISFFGRKDYQQALVIQAMVADLDIPIRVQVVPTVREADGLAMSSRNAYLSAAERLRGVGLWQSLQLAQELYIAGRHSAAELTQAVRQALEPRVDRIEYIGVADPRTLEPVTEAVDGTVILLAARVGNTRLIDNVALSRTPIETAH